MDECSDEHFVSATRRDSVTMQRDGKLLDEGDVKAGAEECVVDEKLAWKVYRRRRSGDGLLCLYLHPSKDECAAWSA